VTHETTVNNGREQAVEGEVPPADEMLPHAQMRDFVAAEGRRATDDKLKELWHRAATGLREADHSRDAQLAAIGRDVRLIGDMMLNLSARLEALENARTSNFAHVRDAWERQAGDETAT